jgi:hypothetical protein
MIFGQRLIPQNELLVRNLAPCVRITPTFTGVDDYSAHVLVVDIAARKDDR